MINKNQQVIERLLARRDGKKDDYKIGLILQGGGMRSCFGGGVMSAIEEIGLSDSFDVIYGSSAGSCIGAYLLSHQTKLGSPIYWEELAGKNFIKPWHPFKKMDLDYFCDYILKEKRKLDVEKVRSSKTLLKICVTEQKTGKLKFFTNKDKCDLLQIIKASCSYPGFFYPLVKINGNKFVDGDTNRLLPLEEAINDKCTDLLIVATIPEDYEKPNSLVFNFFHYFLTLPLGKNLQKTYRKRKREYNMRLDYIFGRKPLSKNLNLYTIHPNYNVRNSETDPKVLKKFMLHGKKVAKSIFKVGIHN